MMLRRTRRLHHAGYVLLILLALAACRPAKPPGYRPLLLPPATPAAPGAALDILAPELEPEDLTYSLPASWMDPSAGLPLASPAPLLVRQAEAHFEAGRRHFRAGLMEPARREFDLAIETLLSGGVSGPNRTEIERKLTELAEAIHQYDISGLGANVPEAEPAFEGSPLEEIPELTFPIDPKLRDQVSEQLKVTASQLPLVVNDDVLRYIDYFTSGRGRKTLLNGLRRAGRFRPMIRRILDEEGVPQELIHLAQAESGFSPRAVSRKRATGMWQFVLWRGEQYGLMRTRLTDDRLDPEKATRAAARHLRDLYHQFGDWYLAMAAYNCGPVCVERAVERTGYADVWELRRRSVLPKETSNYLPIILAMAIVAKSPARYGIEAVEPDAPLEYSTVELDAPTHLALIADITDRSPAEIRELNPALLTAVAPAHYPVHVPNGAGPAVLSALEMIPASKRTAWRLYRVSEGDTLASIARLHKTTPQQVAAANTPAGEIPEAGAFLVVPAAARPAPAAPAPAPAAAKKKAPPKTAPAAKASVKRQPAAKTAAASAGTAVAAARPSGRSPSPVAR